MSKQEKLKDPGIQIILETKENFLNLIVFFRVIGDDLCIYKIWTGYYKQETENKKNLGNLKYNCQNKRQ